MFELFVMSLHEYWDGNFKNLDDLEGSLSSLKSVLSQHFDADVDWNDPEVKPADGDVEVERLTDVQLTTLQLVAAKLELDNTLDGLEFDLDEPWESPIFERLEDEIIAEDSDKDLEKFPHLLSLGNSRECLMLPVDLPHIASVDMSDDDDDDESCDHDHEHSCGCGCHDDECCGFEEDDNAIDVSSTIAIRRELDVLADKLGVDKTVDMRKTKLTFDEDDPLHQAKIAWHTFSSVLNEAIDKNLPLIFLFNDEIDEDCDENGDN